jgi:hypothetical protein
MAYDEDDRWITVGVWFILAAVVIGLLKGVPALWRALADPYKRDGDQPAMQWVLGIWLISLGIAFLIGLGSPGAGLFVGALATATWVAATAVISFTLRKRVDAERQDDLLPRYTDREWWDN